MSSEGRVKAKGEVCKYDIGWMHGETYSDKRRSGVLGQDGKEMNKRVC